jgi:hypothetical protein
MTTLQQIEKEAFDLYEKALSSAKGKYTKSSPLFKELIIEKLKKGKADFIGKLNNFKGNKETLLSTVKRMDSSDILNKYHSEAYKEFY